MNGFSKINVHIRCIQACALQIGINIPFLNNTYQIFVLVVELYMNNSKYFKTLFYCVTIVNESQGELNEYWFRWIVLKWLIHARSPNIDNTTQLPQCLTKSWNYYKYTSIFQKKPSSTNAKQSTFDNSFLMDIFPTNTMQTQKHIAVGRMKQFGYNQSYSFHTHDNIWFPG